MEFPWLSLGFNGNHRNWRNLLGFRGISMAKLFENSDHWRGTTFPNFTILLATMNHVCYGQKLDLIPRLEEGHHHLKGFTYPF